jgi:hypothetical protein
VFGILGSYFFEDTNGQSVTVTLDCYLVMLQEFLLEELRQWRVDTRLVWFQQDCATAHTARISMQTMREIFLKHVMSRFGEVACPPLSPDLSACDFFLWGYLEQKVYVNHPHTIQDVKGNIQAEISQNMLQKVINGVRQSVELCLNSGEVHPSDVTLKK